MQTHGDTCEGMEMHANLKRVESFYPNSLPGAEPLVFSQTLQGLVLKQKRKNSIVKWKFNQVKFKDLIGLTEEFRNQVA